MVSNMKFTHKKTQRSGLTLLFTISMIVLFLLMGTAFVVVANDYFKVSQRRIRASVNVIDSSALLDRALKEVVRGPSLSDPNSPLKTHSILEDQYGHGFTTSLSGVPIGTTGDTNPIAQAGLKVLRFVNPVDSTALPLISMLDGSVVPVGLYGHGVLSGRVLTIASGEGAGYSSRIVSDRLNDDGAGNLELLIVIPADEQGIDWSRVDLDAQSGTPEVRVVINGRDFSGTGVGLAGGGTPDFDSTSPPALLANLTEDQLRQYGSSRNDVATFLGGNNRTNESFDVPGDQNLFLASDTVRSFESSNFVPTGVEGGGFDQDVDINGDGIDDAVWLDIGLPTQTDSLGRSFRPMVAYRIIDMDSRLNLNVHGSFADWQIGSVAGSTDTRRGSSYGAAEVSLRDVVRAPGASAAAASAAYQQLLNLRSGNDANQLTPTPGNADNALQSDQTLFGYRGHLVSVGGFFATGLDLFGRSVIGRNAGAGSLYGAAAQPEFGNVFPLTNDSSATGIPYAADLGIGGGVGDSLFQAFELEALLRGDADAQLSSSRLVGFDGLAANLASITTDSAEVSMPPDSVAALLRDQVTSLADHDSLLGRGYLSSDVLMGGKFDLNQAIGNGEDDNGNGIVDEPSEVGAGQLSSQHDTPVFMFDIGNIDRASKARQLFTLALLVTGNGTPGGSGQNPPMFLSGGTFNNLAYRRAVAQWAVNVVDFADTDSICTRFEYFTDPFNPASNATDVVWGAERPEMLFSEVVATHDRRNQDLGTDADGDTTDSDGDGTSDDDWDSGMLPETSLFIELFHPWTQSDVANVAAPASGTTDTRFQRLPAEYGSNQGVDISAMAGDSPVWRIGVRRSRQDTGFLRAIFFADPTAAPAGVRVGGVTNNFYPSYQTASGSSVDVPLVQPGEYLVLGSSGNTSDAEFRTTFGRRSSGLPDNDMTRSIVLDNDTAGGTGVEWLEWDGTSVTDASGGNKNRRNCDVAVIDMPRSLSVSDLDGVGPDGGYLSVVQNEGLGLAAMQPEDGTALLVARDTPLDGIQPNDDDRNAIWTNGVTDGFRVLYLQRLADPTQEFDATTNPYLTIDTMDVDLFAFNGLTNNPRNNTRGQMENYVANANTGGVVDGESEFRTIERGEAVNEFFETDHGATVVQRADAARRTFFRTERTVQPQEDTNTILDSHNLSFEFNQTLGIINDSIVGSAAPMGHLVWNNRPFANKMELFHVPLHGNEFMLDRFNFCRALEEVEMLDMDSTDEEVFAYYLSDDKFGHLMGFGGTSAVTGGAGSSPSSAMGVEANLRASRRAVTIANRFDNILDFVEVPSRFQGLSKWLDPSLASLASVMTRPPANGLNFSLQPPFHRLPSFRRPGMINLNTMKQQLVYNAARGGFGNADFNDITVAQNSDLFNSSYRAQYVSPNASGDANGTVQGRTNGMAGLFRGAGVPGQRLFDFNSNGTSGGINFFADTDSSSWFDNEFRQRIGSVATTRSSVFAIWITIGYFEVDETGQVGNELGADEGEARRDRAFYMLDRSIPVACEPGKDHNIDQAILVRSIVE